MTKLFIKKLYILLFSIAISSSCNSQPTVINYKPIALDPYYSKTNDTIATHGPRSITRNILQDKNGRIWFSTWEGIIEYKNDTFINHTLKSNLIKFHVFSLLEDSKGNLWFGTIRGGLYQYDGKNWTLYTAENGLSDNAIGCIYEDKTGLIWIGTMNGVSCYDGKIFKNYFTEDGLSNNDVNSIIQDQNGTIWFGTRGEGLCFYKDKKFHSFKNKEGKPFNQVRCIIKDKNNILWFGGNDGLWRYDGQLDTVQLNGETNSFQQIENKSLTQYNKNFVGYIYEDKIGNIWTSSEGASARQWELSCYKYHAHTINLIEPIIIKNQNGQLFGIVEDDNGDLWIGTEYGTEKFEKEEWLENGEKKVVMFK